MDLRYILVLYLIQYVQASIEDNISLRLDPLVYTKLGLIRGIKATNGDYSMFMGIPYAQVNPGNPFGPSIPHPAFDDVFDAYDDSAICPQIEEFNNTIVGTLDCLHLNIYVPSSASVRAPLPVLIWIYGGGFQIGFAGRYLYGPKYLVRHDIIVVTINYRVGPYGFMCLDIPEVPGNQGLKDQLAGLRWIKEHIASFGGDVNKITIMGESAGAASVDLHLHSDQEALYHKAILQSGTGMSSWVIGEVNEANTLRLAARLGYTTTDIRSSVEFLSDIDPKLIIAASAEIGARWNPCIEKDYDNNEKFISDYPINTKVPKVKDMPVLLGSNYQETIAWYYNSPDEHFPYIIEDILKTGFDFEEQDAMEDVVKHFYLGDEKPSHDTKWDVIDFDSDFRFNHPAERLINKYLDSEGGSIYRYVFSYVGNRNYVRIMNNVTSGGAAHADEVSYLFDFSYMDTNATPEDQLVIDRMTAMWANFVKYGNPTPETTDLLPVKWDPVTKEKMPYLDIGAELRADYRPFHSRMSFWDLFYQLNREKQKGYKEN